MDDLKQKLRNFRNKQGLKSPTLTTFEEPSTRSIVEDPVVISRTSHMEISQVQDTDSVTDEAILASINPAFFNSEGFDACDHEIKKLPEVLDSAAIMKDFEKLKQQHAVVSKKVLQLIEQKEETCKEEINKFTDLHQELNQALRICREGRTDLNMAKRQFTTASLGILANYRKRQLVQGLLNYLKNIKTLQRTEERLQELLNEGNYPEAISLLLECQRAASTYRHFTCVAALSGKLQDTLEMTEEQLDGALAKVCNQFDSNHYSKVQAAYHLLGKNQVAMDQLHMHFTKAVTNAAFTVVYSHVGTTTNAKEFHQLCKFVRVVNFIPCLIELCKALWGIIRSYSQVVVWHHKNDSERLAHSDSKGTSDFEANCNKQYVKQKLEKCLGRIWQDVQLRISYYLAGSDLSWYKFEEFLQVLSIVRRLMEVGEEFCGSRSEDLQNSIKEQSRNYFRNYHKGRLEELRIFLENEGWEICPVKPKFSILHLQEFRSLRTVLKSLKSRDSSGLGVGSPDCSSNHSQDGSSTLGGYFARYAETGTPFDISLDESQDEDILANLGDVSSSYYTDESDEDIPEELKEDFVDENILDSRNSHTRVSVKKISRREFLKAPVLTNTALTVLRQCGKYMQMTRLLHPIANDVIVGMSQLFDYYLYAVHTFFTADLPDSCHSVYSLVLQTSLERIQGSLIQPSQVLPQTDQDQHKSRDKITELHMSPVVDLSIPEYLHGLSERVVAVESLVFLAKQLEFLQGYLAHLQGPQGNSTPFLQTLDIATELRRPVYMCVSARAVDFKNTVTLMNKVNWEVEDVMSDHSQYVDILLRELQIFSMRLEGLGSRIPIPREVYTILWENIISQTCNTFVEGFSSTKKCSNGGRALMQLDFTQFLSKLEKLTSVRPIPNKEFVEMYVKAYYLPEASLDMWIRDHKEYSVRQLQALVSCACHNDRKSRQRLDGIIQEYRMGR